MHLISRALLSGVSLLFAFPVFAHVGQVNTQAAFQPCEDAQYHVTLRGSECATVAVPLDYQDPTGGTIDLFVRKFPASEPAAGQFWMVAGGPGESGASFYPMLEMIRQLSREPISLSRTTAEPGFPPVCALKRKAVKAPEAGRWRDLNGAAASERLTPIGRERALFRS